MDRLPIRPHNCSNNIIDLRARPLVPNLISLYNTGRTRVAGLPTTFLDSIKPSQSGHGLFLAMVRIERFESWPAGC